MSANRCHIRVPCSSAPHSSFILARTYKCASASNLWCKGRYHETRAQALLQHHLGEHVAAVRAHHAEQAEVGPPLQPCHCGRHMRAGCQLRHSTAQQLKVSTRTSAMTARNVKHGAEVPPKRVLLLTRVPATRTRGTPPPRIRTRRRSWCDRPRTSTSPRDPPPCPPPAHAFRRFDVFICVRDEDASRVGHLSTLEWCRERRGKGSCQVVRARVERERRDLVCGGCVPQRQNEVVLRHEIEHTHLPQAGTWVLNSRKQTDVASSLIRAA